VEALRHEDYDLLARVAKDHLHQPKRKAFIPGYDRVVAAGKEAGAAAVVLSGQPNLVILSYARPSPGRWSMPSGPGWRPGL
jgi:homoserine kinase